MRILGAPASGRRGRKRVKVWYNPYKKRMEGESRNNQIKSKYVQTKLPVRDHNDDGVWVGDILDELPSPEQTRFVLSNCHGLRMQSDTNFLKSQFQSYLSTGSHFASLTEINVNVRRPGNKQKILDCFRELIMDGKLHLNNGTATKFRFSRD